MNYPLVTLIVVNYNGKGLLKRNLPSLIQTNYFPFEIIVVDNASSDGSVDFVKLHFPNVRIIALKMNSGYSGAANIGAKHAKGSILGLLNTDVRVTSGWLKELVDVMIASPEVGAVAPKKMKDDASEILDGAGGQINILLAGGDRGYLELDCGQYNKNEAIPYPPGAAYLIKREIIDKCGYFLDPLFFMYFDDPEVGARLHLLGYISYYVASSKIYHEHGATAGLYTPKILVIFRRNQLIYLYKFFGFDIFVKMFPVLLTFNAIKTFHQAISTKDGRFMASIFLPFLQFIAKFRSIELDRKHLLLLSKNTPKKYFDQFSSEFSLTPMNPNRTTLVLLATLARMVNKYLVYTKLNAPLLTTIRVVKSPTNVEIYKI